MSLWLPRLSAGVDTAVVHRRWHTGNKRLAPLSLLDDQVVFAGEQSVGLLDTSHPAPRWNLPHRLSGGSVFRPRAADGRILCGGLHELTSWLQNDGAVVWRRPAHAQFGVPLLNTGRIYVGDGNTLLALHADSGETLWRFDALPDTRINYAPALIGNTVMVGPGDGRLYALDALSGKQLWRVNRIGEWQYLRQLHVSDGTLIAGSYLEKLYGIESMNGDVLWTFNAGNFINSHQVTDGVAYFWSPTGWLYAIDCQNGKVKWRHRTTDYRQTSGNWGSLIAELITRDGRLFALDLDNTLHVLALEDGRELLRRRIQEPVRPFVLPISGDTVLCGTVQGDIVKFSLR